MLTPTDQFSSDIQATENVHQFGLVQMRKAILVVAVALAALLVVFDLGWIPGLKVEIGVVGTVGVYLGAAYIVAMGLLTWFFYGRILSQQAVRVSVSASGMLAVFKNQSTVSMSWLDPNFNGELTDWAPDSTNVLTYRWHVGERKAWARITRAGSELLQDAAQRQKILVRTITKGKPPRTWTVTKFGLK